MVSSRRDYVMVAWQLIARNPCQTATRPIGCGVIRSGGGPQGLDSHVGKSASTICVYLRLICFHLCVFAALREIFLGLLVVLTQLRATFLGDEQEQDDEVE